MRFLAACVFAILAAPTLAAADDRQLAAIWDAMRVDEFVDLLSQEGIAESRGLEDSLFPGEGGAAWLAVLQKLYDRDAMAAGLRAELSRHLAERDISGAIDFYQSPLGRQSISLEISARRAQLDPDIDAESRETAARMEEAGDPRIDLIAEYADANGLIENNVVGALNGNYAFMSALADAGQGPFLDDPGAILSEVWSQEDAIRAETRDWVMASFVFAYQPLSDGEVERLIDFSRTPGGRRLNAALFGAFDGLFGKLAFDLGHAAATFMKGERL